MTWKCAGQHISGLNLRRFGMEVNMEENRIIINTAGKETRLLPVGGTDSRGNLWQADNLSFLKNGKRFFR